MPVSLTQVFALLFAVVLTGCVDRPSSSSAQATTSASGHDDIRSAVREALTSHNPACIRPVALITARDPVFPTTTYGRLDSPNPSQNAEQLRSLHLANLLRVENTSNEFGQPTLTFDLSDYGASMLKRVHNQLGPSYSFCFATPRLVEIVSSKQLSGPERARAIHEARETVVRYGLTDVADWARVPAVLEEFPEVTSLLDASEDGLQDTIRLARTDEGWRDFRLMNPFAILGRGMEPSPNR
jgi:hypothetical protein